MRIPLKMLLLGAAAYILALVLSLLNPSGVSCLLRSARRQVALPLGRLEPSSGCQVRRGRCEAGYLRRRHKRHHSHRSAVIKNNKRRALDLAVNRLHILESLDGQLREFAARASAAQRANSTKAHKPELFDQVCQLRLELGRPGEPVLRQSGGQMLPDCLAEARLARHVPPYMLNLQRQIMSQSRTMADAVRLMPYRALVMRSFAQPSLPVASDSGLFVPSGQDRRLVAGK